ncbi:hypothetical protein, partial [Burkholderia ubonensis]|uniref:hypothetical protein n=1 Tax=Burkholderia ubonensis TaxID=101571 RepID=UPI001E5DF3CE
RSHHAGSLNRTSPAVNSRRHGTSRTLTICISSDKFIDVDAINSLWSPKSHLFAVHKYKHELPFSFLFRGLLNRCELLLLFRHLCNDPQSANAELSGPHRRR